MITDSFKNIYTKNSLKRNNVKILKIYFIFNLFFMIISSFLIE